MHTRALQNYLSPLLAFKVTRTTRISKNLTRMVINANAVHSLWFWGGASHMHQLIYSCWVARRVKVPLAFQDIIIHGSATMESRMTTIPNDGRTEAKKQWLRHVPLFRVLCQRFTCLDPVKTTLLRQRFIFNRHSSFSFGNADTFFSSSGFRSFFCVRCWCFGNYGRLKNYAITRIVQQDNQPIFPPAFEAIIFRL